MLAYMRGRSCLFASVSYDRTLGARISPRSVFVGIRAMAQRIKNRGERMPKSLIFELPKIVEEGRREAQRVLERIGSGTHIGLQTNELVLPGEKLPAQKIRDSGRQQRILRRARQAVLSKARENA